MEPKQKIIVFLVAIFLGGAFWYLYGMYSGPDVIQVAPVSDQQVENVSKPTVEEVSQELPSGFPTDIPIEAGAVFNQNYTADAEGQQQMTIVFPSKVSIKDNHVLYAAYLKEKGWTVTNSYESENLSSLYALREDNEVNVTVSAVETSTDEMQSQVSISVLKK